MEEKVRKFRKVEGFTMVELLVAIAVGSIVMALIATAFWSQTKTSKNQQSTVGMQQNIRSAMYFIEQDVMMAGFEDDTAYNTNPGITETEADRFAFTYADPDCSHDGIDNDGDGTIDNEDEQDGINNDGDSHTDETDEIETVRIFLNGNGQLIREFVEDSTGNPRQTDVVADNIQGLEFFYIRSDGTASTSYATADDRETIRKVGISVLARTEFPNTGYTDMQTYTTLSGTVWGPFTGSDPADPDNYKHNRRELVTTTVLCRNLMIRNE